MGALQELAEAAGLAVTWQNYRGDRHQVADDALRAVLAALELPAGTDAEIRDSRAHLAEAQSSLAPLITAVEGERIALPVQPGEYDLSLEDGSGASGRLEPAEGGATLPAIDLPGYHLLRTAGSETTIAVAPRGGFTVADLGLRPWALAVQLYALRRRGDAGIGDFAALSDLAAPAARRGAAAIAISPVHAQFSADPHRYSPYSPSSRINLNVLHAAFDWPRDDETRFLEREPLVNWPEATRRRLQAMRDAFDDLSPSDRQALAGFRAERGDTLETHARFEAIHAEQFGRYERWHWRTWPEALRHPGNPAVAEFARRHADDVAFHAFMQWRADQGLAAAQRAARNAGMPIGLIADLAVGADSGGSHCWARQDQVLLGLSIGAPPDLLNVRGQSWGLTAFSPAGLHAHGFGAFIEMLRAAMRHAGGVRIDHALGLRRLWVVPDGQEPKDGAYLAFPQTDLLRLIALESLRHRTIVLGEDLGTIPAGFQDELAAAGMFGMRVLWFEQDRDGFTAPATWSRAAAAMTSTHDLPTLAGWWRGRDLEWRAKLGLSGGDEAGKAEAEQRQRDRSALWDTMQASGAGAGDQPPDDTPARFVDAASRHVAGAACDLAIIPIEDILGLDEQPNLPGTMGEQHPNWRRRLPAPAAELLDAPHVAERLAAISDARTR